MAMLMVNFNTPGTKVSKLSFGQQHLLKKAIKIYGEKGKVAAKEEIGQLYKRTYFTPIHIEDLTPEERRHAMEALMFVTEKKDGRMKGRMVCNGKPTREWLSRDDNAGPTASQESIVVTSTIDAKENRDVMSCDIPNAFIQAEVPGTEKEKERIMMKIDMRDYVEEMIQNGPVKLGKDDTAKTPAGDNLFQIGNRKMLEKERAEAFHTTVAKGLFLCKRGRPDIQPTIAWLCTRVKEPNKHD